MFGLATGCCQQNYENTDPEGFAKLIAEPGVVILDVRTAEEFNEGHIEGALFIDWKQDGFMEKAQATLPKVLFPYHYGQTDVKGIPLQLKDSGIDVRIRHYE